MAVLYGERGCYDAVVNFEIGSAMAQLSVWMGASVVAAGM